MKPCRQSTHLSGGQGGGLRLVLSTFAPHQERPVVGQLQDVVARVSCRHLAEGLGRGDGSRLVPSAAPGKLEGDLMLTMFLVDGVHTVNNKR